MSEKRADPVREICDVLRFEPTEQQAEAAHAILRRLVEAERERCASLVREGARKARAAGMTVPYAIDEAVARIYSSEEGSDLR